VVLAAMLLMPGSRLPPASSLGANSHSANSFEAQRRHATKSGSPDIIVDSAT